MRPSMLIPKPAANGDQRFPTGVRTPFRARRAMLAGLARPRSTRQLRASSNAAIESALCPPRPSLSRVDQRRPAKRSGLLEHRRWGLRPLLRWGLALGRKGNRLRERRPADTPSSDRCGLRETVAPGSRHDERPYVRHRRSERNRQLRRRASPTLDKLVASRPASPGPPGEVRRGQRRRRCLYVQRLRGVHLGHNRPRVG